MKMYRSLILKPTVVFFFLHQGFWNGVHCTDPNRSHETINEKTADFAKESSARNIQQCPNGWSYFGTKCYKTFGIGDGEKENWDDANRKCLDMNTTLVSIHSAEEQEFIWQMLSRRTDYEALWIGLRENVPSSPRTFLWTDNSSFDYSKWAVDQPNNFVGQKQECVEFPIGVFPHHGYWNDETCSVTQPYVCQINIGETVLQEIESENGTIQSPNYPNNYEPQKRYVWIIKVPENYQIFLEFTDFELQGSTSCSSDFVVVRDGNGTTGQLLGKFCGTNVEKYMRSSENVMTIVFQSGDSLEGRGFSANFRKADVCNFTIEGISGNISTPNYPNNYGPVERCYWNIIVPEDHHVLFTFFSFNIADSSSCAKDFISIYNGNSTTSTRIGKYCGSNAPNVSKSTTSHVLVEFQSDASVEAQGFYATFTADICGEEYNSDSGTFHSPNYPNGHHSHEMCSWKVTVQEGYRVGLRFDSILIEDSYRSSASSVRIFDGLNQTSPEITKLFGIRLYVHKFHSSGNTLSVRFVTYDSYSKSGFSASFVKAPIPPSIGDTSPAPTLPCEKNITSDSGTINSPGYPQWYSANSNCTWNIQVPEGKLIRLEFQSFNVENVENCGYDFVQVRDGKSIYSPFLGKYCGADVPEPLWSSYNHMVVWFFSDGSFENSGFSATFTKVDYKEVLLNADNGTVESPNYPNNYAPSQLRVWKISVPSNHIILLRFLSFDLEYEQNCTNDFVKVFEPNGFTIELPGKFCGSSAPQDIRTSGNKLTVIFATDTSEELKGFSAKFEKEPICGDDSCRNGGTCQRISRGVYSCICKHGYEGNFCQEKTLCTNNRCENDGLCFQNGTDGVFQCVCSHGYQGGVCHERILCGNETCKNGGYCTHSGKYGTFLCVCEPGFEGLLCEKLAQKSAGDVVSTVVPVVILIPVVIASAAILFYLIRRRHKQQTYDDMKKDEMYFDKDETLD